MAAGRCKGVSKKYEWILQDPYTRNEELLVVYAGESILKGIYISPNTTVSPQHPLSISFPLYSSIVICMSSLYDPASHLIFHFTLYCRGQYLETLNPKPESLNPEVWNQAGRPHLCSRQPEALTGPDHRGHLPSR